MKFFIYCCECNTPTDGVIFRGVYNLLNQVYPNVEYSHLPDNSRGYRDMGILSDSDLLSGEKFDAIIVPGSPFLWHYYYDTPKIKNLLRAKEIHKCPIIWMGVGACLPEDHLHLFDDLHFQKTKEIFGNDLVIVRDKIAKSIMDQSGVIAHNLVCPSFFSQGVTAKSKENLIVFYEPTIGLSWQGWTDKAKLEEYYDIFREFNKLGCDVVVKDIEEVEFGEKIGLTNIRVLQDTDDCLNTVKEYKNVLSGRVHCAVPAMVAGCNIGIIPIDTRYTTITDFLDCAVRNKSDLNNMKILNKDLTEDLEIYRILLREFL